MRTRLWIASVLVFTVGLALFVSAKMGKANAKMDKPQNVARSFTATYLVYKVDASGAKELMGVNVRYAKATGEWLETRHSFDGNTSVWAATSDAVYSMTKGATTREFRSRYGLEVDQVFRSASFLKNHPEFNRTEEIAGVATYVHRASNDKVFAERSFAPECGLSALRTFFRGSNGEGFIEEAVSLEFRGVSDEEVTLPDAPVNFDYVERKIESLRASGLIEGAARLEGLVREMAAKEKNR